MRYLGLVGLLLCAAAGQVAAHNLPPCDYAAIPDLRQANDREVAKHGNHEVGPVMEPAGAVKSFDFFVDYVIDETGHVSCLSGAEVGEGDIPLIMTPARQAALNDVATWTFTPFRTDGQPAKVLVQAYISEVEQPARHIPRPEGDLASLQIRLESSGRRSGDGPFIMTVKGDGTLNFEPSRYDDGAIVGPQTYHISPEQVAAILDLADKADFWSLRDAYYTRFSFDAPGLAEINESVYRRVSIALGGHVKEVRYHDAGYGGSGASEAVWNLMANMAEIAGLELWHHIDDKTLAVLETNGFDFKSGKGGQLLMMLASKRQISDAAIQQVIDSGAPTDLIDNNYFLEASLLDSVIDGRRLAMAQGMIDRGALLKDGQPDPQSITRALAHAASSGLPDLVAQLMAYHPVMTMRSGRAMEMDSGTDNNKGSHDVPIIAYVGANGYNVPTADLIAATQQFLDVGQDINSRQNDEFGNDSVLSSAISHGQKDFVTWLLSRGAVAKSSDLLLPFFDEDMTILLLDSGVVPDDESLARLAGDARQTDDSKVEVWLKVHGKWPAKED